MFVDSVKQVGKVRDSYVLGNGKRLIVTTNRLSAFDKVLHHVPYKGQVLNQLSAWWFAQTRDIIPNHLISVPEPTMSLVHDVKPLPIEVIVRGYITGVTSTALWQRYAMGERTIYGYTFPEGLRKNQKLPTSIITPTTKGGPTGHDERLTCEEVVSKGFLDAATWQTVQQAALALFARGQQVAERAGLLLVDTKYEFGIAADGQVMLIDEVHTPDSSRFWKADSYADRVGAGLEPENCDKEFIRLAYVERGYNGEGEAPILPDAVWEEASRRYIRIYEQLTGEVFVPSPNAHKPEMAPALVKKEGGPLAVIIAGSKADEGHFGQIVQSLQHFGIASVVRIASAHKTAEHALEILKHYEADGRPKVYITVAGRSNALSGFIDGYVRSPVIACPPPSDMFGGADIYSSLRMPSGISPALVLDPQNAAFLAARIFALFSPDLADKVKAFQQKQRDTIVAADETYANQQR